MWLRPTLPRTVNGKVKCSKWPRWKQQGRMRTCYRFGNKMIHIGSSRKNSNRFSSTFCWFAPDIPISGPIDLYNKNKNIKLSWQSQVTFLLMGLWLCSIHQLKNQVYSFIRSFNQKCWNIWGKLKKKPIKMEICISSLGFMEPILSFSTLQHLACLELKVLLHLKLDPQSLSWKKRWKMMTANTYNWARIGPKREINKAEETTIL